MGVWLPAAAASFGFPWQQSLQHFLRCGMAGASCSVVGCAPAFQQVQVGVTFPCSGAEPRLLTRGNACAGAGPCFALLVTQLLRVMTL